MFQNIISETEKTKEKLGFSNNILANVISKKYIVLYIVTLMVSMVKMDYNYSPFCLALIAAAVSSEVPIIAIVLLGLIRKWHSIWHIWSGKFCYYIINIFSDFFYKRAKIQ